MLKTDIADILVKKYGKKNPPAIKAGDTVKVYQKIKEGDKERIQVFEGLVIAVKHGQGLDASFTVRKIAVGGIGVERTYPLHSPNVVKVERTKSAKVARAKLYYMRGRKGKTARFKTEAYEPIAWEEPNAEPVEEMEVEEAPVVEEEVMEETVTETAATEEKAEEAPEVAQAAEPTEEKGEEAVTEPEEDTEETVAVAEEPAAEKEEESEAKKDEKAA